jgi:hypothetical protein
MSALEYGFEERLLVAESVRQVATGDLSDLMTRLLTEIDK